MFIHTAYEFLYRRREQGASPHTLRAYACDLNALKAFLETALPEECRPGNIRHDETYSERSRVYDDLLDFSFIDRVVLEAFMDQLREKGASESTIVRRFSALRSFFEFACLNGRIPENPVDGLDVPKYARGDPSCITFNQVQNLLNLPNRSNYLGFRDRTILELLCASALKVGEIVALNREDFHPESSSLSLPEEGSVERLIPISQDATRWVKAYLDHAERHKNSGYNLSEVDPVAVFLNRDGTRLSSRHVDRMFRHYLLESDLPSGTTPHTIRHTVAAQWIVGDMPPERAQQLLGLIDKPKTARYLKHLAGLEI